MMADRRGADRPLRDHAQPGATGPRVRPAAPAAPHRGGARRRPPPLAIRW